MTRRLALVLLGGALAAACGSERGPATLDLARLEVRGLLPSGEVARGRNGPITLDREGDDLWLRAELVAGDWTAAGTPGRFRASLPVLALGHPRDLTTPYRLDSPGGELAYEADPERFGSEAGTFTTDGLDLALQLAPEGTPPASARLAACANVEWVDGDQRRVEGRRLSGSGFWVPPGQPRRVDLAIPPRSALCFATLSTSVLGERAARTAPQRFLVELDGAVLLDQVQANPSVGESVLWHRLELPRGGVRRAQLAFRVEGPFAATAILAPTVRPAEPERDPRRDVVVFLADTFRADGLAAYGAGHGVEGLTPTIDRFAGGARVFERAWSVSTHTLPTHSSLFSGMFPPQNGQVDFFSPLAEEVDTLAERLAAAGYRCGAITDGVMVSAAHGLNQGFEFFDERRAMDSLERAQAFLDAGDGRPTFLFFQTYRTHAPYEPDPATVERLGPRLGLGRDYAALVEDVNALYARNRELHIETPPATEEARGLARELRALYLATVADLDALFAGFLGLLERHGLGEEAVVVFTSDHGEAFFEHGRAFHAGPVWEEELRVPLLVRGPGVAAGAEPRPVSLIDFAPTVSGWAGLEPLASWEGRSWLAPDPARTLYAFQSHRAEGKRMALIDGAHKLIGSEDADDVQQGQWYGAYDLDRDPGELASVLGVEDWPRQLAARRQAELLRLLEPRVTPGASRLTGEHQAEMNQLGYGGDAQR